MNLLVLIITFISMEGLTWLIHKYVMHGFLWVLHRDHHDHSNQQHITERNDLFFIIFAIPAILILYMGSLNHYNYLFYIGLGITLYGFAYFLVHDIFIHQRMKLFRNTNNRYFRGIRRAHKQHHKHLGKEHGECFGFLFAPKKYFNVTKNRQK